MNKKLLVTFIIGMFFISGISALEIDNVKSYDEKEKKITIDNAFGLGSTIAEIKLNTPLQNTVGIGYQKVAEFTVTNYDDYEEALKEIKFYNKKYQDWENHDQEIYFDYKYLTYEKQKVPENNCTNYYLENGTKIEECKTKLIYKDLPVWKELTSKSFKKNEVITIGVFTETYEGQHVEWIPEFFGVEIVEWASWQASWNADLKAYLAFDQSSGINVLNNITSVSNGTIYSGGPNWTASSKIGSGVFYNQSFANSTINITDPTLRIVDDLTICFWFNGSAGNNDGNWITGQWTGNFIIDTTGGFIRFVTQNGGSSISSTTAQDGTWHHYCARRDITGNNKSIWVDGKLEDSDTQGAAGTWTGTVMIGSDQSGSNSINGTLDEMAWWARSLSDAEIIGIYNDGLGLTYNETQALDITLNSPEDDLETTDNNIEFNSTVVSIDNPLKNVTLLIDGIRNETNSTGINASEYLFEKTLSFADHNWSIEACDTLDNCLSSNTRDFNITNFIERNITFNSLVLETDYEEFEVNITTIPEIISVSAFLNYNGTRYPSTTSCSGINCMISNSIDIPLNINLEHENKTFFWEITSFDGSNSVTLNTSQTEQNVTRIHLEKCEGGYEVEALNFTAYDERNLTRLDLFDFEATFLHWVGSGTIKRSNNFTNLNISNQSLCVSPNSTSYIDAQIDYDQSGNNSIYTKRNYYFQNNTISNVTQDIFLYLLESSRSTSFILKVQDDSLLPVEDILIEINRFYPGTDEFRLVQIARTDQLGKSLGFFETEIVDYKFIISNNTNILLETGLQKIIPETSPFTLTFNIGDPLGEPWSSQNEIPQLTSTLEWDSDTGIVTYTYSDVSGDFDLARLLVVNQSLTNSTADEIVCNVNSTLIAATLTCNVGDQNGFYLASAYNTRFSVESLDQQIGFQIETLSGVVGLLGLFYGWFLILVASFLFKFNEIAGIWAVTVTIFLVNLTGLINFGAVFVTAIFAVAILITWVLEK